MKFKKRIKIEHVYYDYNAIKCLIFGQIPEDNSRSENSCECGWIMDIFLFPNYF